MTDSTKRAASKYLMNQFHDVVNKHEIEKKLKANNNYYNNNKSLSNSLNGNSLTSLSIETGKTSHKVHHIELNMNIPHTSTRGIIYSSNDDVNDDSLEKNVTNKTLNDKLSNDNYGNNQNGTQKLSASSVDDDYYVTSSFQKDQLLNNNNNNNNATSDKTHNNIFPMSSLSKTSLESTSTIIQPLPLEMVSSHGNSEDESKKYEKQISHTDGVLERAYRAIRKRDLNAFESKTAIDLEVNGNDIQKKRNYKPLSSFEEKFHNSPLRQAKRSYWPMQSDYSTLSSETTNNIHHTQSNSDNFSGMSMSSLSRHSKPSSMLDFTSAANVNRPRTRARVGDKLPYGKVVRPYTTAGTSPIKRRSRRREGGKSHFIQPKTDDDKLYYRQQKLIKKFSIDLWGDPRKKPNAFGMDTFDGQKMLRRKMKARKKQRKNIYGKKKLRSLNKHSMVNNSQNLSSHGSLADYSTMSSGSGGGSGLLITTPLSTNQRNQLPHRQTKSRGSLVDPMNNSIISSLNIKNTLRRPNTSGSLMFPNGEPGPESVFNLEMAGLHIPDDPPRKLTDFEKRIKRQRKIQERTNHMIELQTLNNRVKQLEIVLLEERMARKKKNRTPSRKKKRKKKKKKKKNANSKDFVKLAPFKRSATSAVTAMASALAAAASAERFDKAARRLEDSMGEYGMDDELATESARAVERAAKMAGQAIHSATTAIHIAAKLQNDPDVGQMFNTT